MLRCAPDSTLLFAEYVCRVDAQGATHWAGYGERSSEQHREHNSSEYKRILCRRLVDDRRKYPARGDTEQHPDDGPAGQQDQHTTKRGRENLLRLRTERDPNAQLA